MEFKLHAPFKPTGDQPEAIEKLAQGVKMGLDEQVLLGVTGSGKTFTMASVIEKVQRPTLVLAHNKTLAAQLCAEFKEFFPENAVEYFVSYYDYYQPEAYIPHTDTYIAKDASTNEEIDRLRLSATCALLERRDVIVVSSVSCIYGLGEPEDFEKLMISLRPGMTMERDFLLKRLIEIRYERNDVAFERNRFRVRGDTVELYPAYYRDKAVRVEFFGDEIDRISEFNPVNGQVTRTLQHIAIYPASHYVTTKDKLERAIVEIDKELDEREAQFLAEGKAVEAQRIRQRTRYDIEMLRELGYCTGIENYSRVISGRPVGSPPLTLIDYFPKDFLLFVDESHVTLPQVRAMYNGDRARKESLVEYGFRLPCAFDNRPLLNAGIAPENLVVIRNLGGLAVLALFFLCTDRSVFKMKAKHLPIFIATGIISVVLFTLCYFNAQKLCSLSVSAILLYTAPAMVVLMSALVFKEKITGKKLLALALALLGCALVTGVFTGGLSLTTKGMLFGLGAAFFYALYSIFAPFGLRHYSPLAVVFWTFVFAALGALFVADWGNLVTVLSVPQNALLAAGLVLLSTVAPYILYTKGLANVESGKASIMASIEPVVGTLVGTLVFGEPISAGVFLGLACILACVYILR